jgi:hypothetical protein
MPTSTSDSLKIFLPSETVKPGFAYFSARNSSQAEKARTPGLQTVTYERSDRRCAVIEISSKLLPGTELIHRGNIGLVFDKINETERIEILPGAIEQAYCLTIDAATDIIVPGSTELLKVINVLAYHSDYRKQSHPRNANTTFYFTGSKRSKYAGKAKVYDKFAEDKEGYFEPGTIRCELTCSTSKSIQHSYGVGANREGRILLLDVLNSEANPVADRLEKILGSLYAPKAEDVALMKIVRSSPSEGIDKAAAFLMALPTQKDMQVFSMLSQLDFDLGNIYKLLKGIQKSRTGKAKVLEPYARILTQYNGFKEDVTIEHEGLLSLREQLRNPSFNTTQYQALAAAA